MDQLPLFHRTTEPEEYVPAHLKGLFETAGRVINSSFLIDCGVLGLIGHLILR